MLRFECGFTCLFSVVNILIINDLHSCGKCVLQITNGTKLVNNTAVTNGGAVDCSGCQTLTMQYQSSATSNVAQEYGGGLSCSGCTQLQMHQSTLTNNRYIFLAPLLRLRNMLVACILFSMPPASDASINPH